MTKSKQQILQNCAESVECPNQKASYVNLSIEEQQCSCKKNTDNNLIVAMQTKSCQSQSNENESENNENNQQLSEKKQSTGFINVPLIPLKLILFSWYAAGACLLPYMTLHMKQLGLNMPEMTAVYAILPIIQLFGTPIAGFIADKTGNYKSVLMLSLSTCIVATFLIQFAVPARKQNISLASLNNSAAAAAAAATAAASVSNEETQDSSQETLYMVTFWLYLIIRIFHQVAVGLTYVLLDTTTIVLAEQNNSTYGRQRFWAILATGVFSPICGFVIDNYSYTHIDELGKKVMNYDPAFYFFNALTLFTLIKVSMIKVEISSLPRNIWHNVAPLLRSANVWIFLFAVFIMGSCWGFLESFLFVYLQNELNAPNYLLGLTVTVGAFIGLPFLFGSDWFIKKFGAIQLLLLALIVYFIRLVGYSTLENPWWCIPYELMEAFTLHLMWVSTVQLAYQISPPGMLATLQAVVGGLNFGVGRGFGSLVGGSVIVFYGNRIAFRVVGCMALFTAILYALLHYLCLPPLEIHDKKSKLNNSNNNANKQQQQTTLNVSTTTTTNNEDNFSHKCSAKSNTHQNSKRRRQTAKDFEASGPEQTAAANSELRGDRGVAPAS